MSSTFTRSDTFTRTHAGYLASKVAADLHQMQRFYGRPTSGEIDDYLEELTTLLAGGYLDYIEYGFRRNSDWTLCFRYTATPFGLDTDDRPGRVLVGANISGASWYSYLVKNDAWSLLGDAERQRLLDSIPVKRTSASTPGLGDGYWVEDKTYSRNGVALGRRTFHPS